MDFSRSRIINHGNQMSEYMDDVDPREEACKEYRRLMLYIIRPTLRLTGSYVSRLFPELSENGVRGGG